MKCSGWKWKIRVIRPQTAVRLMVVGWAMWFSCSRREFALAIIIGLSWVVIERLLSDRRIRKDARWYNSLRQTKFHQICHSALYEIERSSWNNGLQCQALLDENGTRCASSLGEIQTVRINQALLVCDTHGSNKLLFGSTTERARNGIPVSFIKYQPVSDSDHHVAEAINHAVSTILNRFGANPLRSELYPEWIPSRSLSFQQAELYGASGKFLADYSNNEDKILLNLDLIISARRGHIDELLSVVCHEVAHFLDSAWSWGGHLTDLGIHANPAELVVTATQASSTYTSAISGSMGEVTLWFLRKPEVFAELLGAYLFRLVSESLPSQSEIHWEGLLRFTEQEMAHLFPPLEMVLHAMAWEVSS